MTALQSADHLERSLEALGPRQAALAAAIRTAGPHPGLTLEPSRSGSLTGSLDGTPLASRHRPEDEARRLADNVDLTEHAVVVVHGFGLGYHVAELCRRMGRTGVIIVLETDRSLLHSVLGAIDHSEAIAGANLLIVTDPEDRASLARDLQDAEWLLGQGLCFLGHPPSRERLEPDIRRFGEMLTGVATHARMTITTTLVRSVDTVRNLTGNLARYTTAPGVAELAGIQAGRPAILVAAGPSLGPALEALADPALRERAVIIAVQTTLRPLLERGIRPHFVTALDYHEISTRFYEGLTPADVAGIELVVDPKAHPSILAAFPGTVRCCRAGMLDTLLGDAARDMGSLPAGATVAHLSAYLARHIGCDPIITVGQDLAFTDGLYYGPGAVIHDVWGPELGTFNPITSMEWQRIARHRSHLERVESWDGGSVLSDAQMVTYRQQFERDFAADADLGRRVIDVTGPGGARKHGAERMDLADAIAMFADRPLDPMPPAPAEIADAAERRHTARTAVAATRQDVRAIADASATSERLLDRMLESQDDAAKMTRLFDELSVARKTVESRMTAFGLIEQLNQLGTFKRVRADRRMALSVDLPARDRQRAELERDRVNVEWIGAAAEELITQLDDAAHDLAPGDEKRSTPKPRVPRPTPTIDSGAATDDDDAAAGRVGAVIAIDAADAERLGAPFGSTTLLGASLERLGRSRLLDAVVLVVEAGVPDVLAIPSRVGEHDLHVITVDEPPLGPRGRAIRIARAGATGAWRGGIAGFGGADDGLSPLAMDLAIEAHHLAAVIPCGPDRPLLDAANGIDRLIERWREHPDVHRIVFSPLPPGLGAVLVRRDLAADFRGGGRLAGAGPMLVHQPHAPQGDPLTTDACVPITPELRRHVDAIAGDDAGRRRLAAIAAGLDASSDATTVVQSLERHGASETAPRPSHLLLELSTGGDCPAWRRPVARSNEPRRTADTDRLVAALRAAAPLDGCMVTLTGDADPLSHPGWRAIAEAARDAGAAAVHVRSALELDPDDAATLADGPIDILSVELHATNPATWTRLHGHDGYDRVLDAINAVVTARRPLDSAEGLGALALPWIVPRMQRRPETIDEIEAFHAHWQRALGTAALEPAWPDEAGLSAGTDPTTRPILPLPTPPAVVTRELRGRMRILADGSIPQDDRDRTGASAIGSITDGLGIADAWATLARRRRGPVTDPDDIGLLEP